MEKRGSWDSMQKSMNKTKTDALLKVDIHSISDLIILEAKVSFEEAKRRIEESNEKIDENESILYEREESVFDLYKITNKVLSMSTHLEKQKDNLYD